MVKIIDNKEYQKMKVEVVNISKNPFIMKGEGFVKQHSGNYSVTNENDDAVEGYVAEGWVITKLGYMIYSYHRSNMESPYLTLEILVDGYKYSTIITNPDDPTDRKIINKYSIEFMEELDKLWEAA